MKKLLVVLAVLFLAPYAVFAYTIDDPPNDAIGVAFETYGIDVSNIYVNPLVFTVYTDYDDPNGLTVGDWDTKPADIFITETWKGNDYLWALPLVDHGSYRAGGLYAVGSFYISNDFEPATGGPYTYNENVPVWINTQGNNYGVENFDGDNPWNFTSTPTVTWGTGSIVINLGGVYMDSNTTALNLFWGTATCGNDVVGSVPEPATMFLLGTGLLSLAALGRKRFLKK